MAYSPNSIFGTIESGNVNPFTAWDYQQGNAFISQFGSGSAGFNNWLTQATANNPNLSWGDAYAQYNTGTGTPGFGATWSDLPMLNNAAYNNASNVFAANGINPNSSIVGSAVSGGGGTGSGTDPFAGDFPQGTGSFYVPGTSQILDYGGGPDNTASNTVTGGGPLGVGIPGMSSPSSGSATSGFFTAVGNWFQNAAFRAIAVIIGIVLVAAAIFMMAGHSFKRT